MSRPPYHRKRKGVVGDYYHCIEQFQKGLVQSAMDRAGGNTTLASEILGIGRNTLVEIRRRLGFPMAPEGRPKMLIHKASDYETPTPACGINIVQALVEQSSFSFFWNRVTCEKCLEKIPVKTGETALTGITGE